VRRAAERRAAVRPPLSIGISCLLHAAAVVN